jgi:ATP-dependent Zn protease
VPGLLLVAASGTPTSVSAPGSVAGTAGGTATSASTTTTSNAPPAPFHTTTSFGAEVQQWLPLALMVILLGLLVMIARRSVPRTNPETIRPEQVPEIVWEDIAGVDEAKAELREVVDYLRNPKRFARVGANVPSGILLHGPPGTGKTLLAKAVAHESGAVFYAQSASNFVEMFAGLGSARIRRLFKAARKHAPAIVFIDEIDAVGGARGIDNREYDQTLNQLLVEMDGFGSTNDVVVIAASNLLEKLDPALLRPGRFDRQVFVSPPDVTGRERILEVHTRRKPLADDIDFGTSATRRPSTACAAARRGSRWATSTTRWSGSWPACSRAGACPTTSAASSPTTRPATPCAPSCCPRSTPCTGSRSSPAAARWATRSTCLRRIATSRRARS